MTERSVLIDKWLIELKKKSRNGVVSNKDIMDLIEKRILRKMICHLFMKRFIRIIMK